MQQTTTALPPAQKKRIVLVVNKSWEADPIISALLNERFSSNSQLLKPDLLNFPVRSSQGQANPRMVWQNIYDTIVEFWCFQDVMDISDPADPDLYSSSEIKYNNLGKILGYSHTAPSLVIALGTAARGGENDNHNGCVTMGGSIFIHDYHPDTNVNPKSKLRSPLFEKLLPSTAKPELFSVLGADDVAFISARLLKPFNNPCDRISFDSGKELCDASVVNITDYKDYEHSDTDALTALYKVAPGTTVSSVETTHGVIRLMCDAPFAYISGITDRVGCFSTDVAGTDAMGNVKTEVQNFTAAFNIGVALSTLLNKKEFYQYV